MAVQDALPVRARRSDGPVRVQGDLPAPAVHRDEMVKSAEQDQIAQAGGAALPPGPDVVHLACGGRLAAAGEAAAAVPQDHRAAQVGRNLLGGLTGVEGQAHIDERPASRNEVAAQERREASGPGEHIGRAGQQRGAEPGQGGWVHRPVRGACTMPADAILTGAGRTGAGPMGAGPAGAVGG